MDERQLRKYIKNFRLKDVSGGDQGYKRVLLQLFGYTGHGKSAFINSCKYAIDGKYKMHAMAEPSDGCVTMERSAYQLTPTLTIVDNKGCTKLDHAEMLEIYAQLGNFFPINEKVERKENYNDYTSQLEEAELHPNGTDILVPILVYSARRGLLEQEKPALKSFLKTCTDITGIAPIVALTFAGESDKEIIKRWEQTFVQMGAESVLEVQNYTDKDSTQERHLSFLNIISCALENVRFCMGRPKEPKQERLKNKKLLLKLAHDYYMSAHIG
ncbi:hypothetical protein XENTR_v10023470 [Xenopus tropicalis]|uniref:Uncharacterized protein LOC100498429 n=1 Tax=Xenopus tropicalis TaxID=8364 RepID=A0A8J0QUV3_XENTR|nr:uncharacterized protein LOC100498429 [Xenopus tropicalis]KAE8578329.1 hypothetical protein XENTR_v10023470 [Xenopus tropicalis]